MNAMITLVDRWLHSHEYCSYFFPPSLFRILPRSIHREHTLLFINSLYQINLSTLSSSPEYNIYLSLVMFVSSPSLLAPRLVADIIRRPNCCNMPAQAALLIGDIDHARKAWEDLSSILTLKVRLTVTANCGVVSG